MNTVPLPLLPTSTEPAVIALQSKIPPNRQMVTPHHANVITRYHSFAPAVPTPHVLKLSRQHANVITRYLNKTVISRSLDNTIACSHNSLEPLRTSTYSPYSPHHPHLKKSTIT